MANHREKEIFVSNSNIVMHEIQKLEIFFFRYSMLVLALI